MEIINRTADNMSSRFIKKSPFSDPLSGYIDQGFPIENLLYQHPEPLFSISLAAVASDDSSIRPGAIILPVVW